MKTGKGNKKCVINIDAVEQEIEHVDTNKFCTVLPGLQAFTGCDSVSATSCYERILSLPKP